ncbi:sex peptide receptor-like [Patella vulgata]|uniref:sex peptide receptor-like n=1 Tax=Patella vulgata TaxID=6465 RepID=UPI00218029C9|nr:sex peptide receptor-like [Patella vulgata]
MEIVNSSNVSTMATPRKETDFVDLIWYLRGPIQFYIIIVVILVNVLLLIMLRKSEMKSLVSTLLSAIAIADLIASLTMFPRAIMFYYLIDPRANPPYSWCRVLSFSYILPVMIHTLSTWFTLLLGVFRYITVCHPTKAAQWCQYRIAYRVIAVMILVSVSIFVCDFFVFKIEPEDIWNYQLNRSETTCQYTYKHWIQENEFIYHLVQDIMRLIFIYIIPSAGLLFITSKLILTMKKANTTRKYLTERITQQTTDSNRTNVLLILVLILFLIVEMPVYLLGGIIIGETYTLTIIIPLQYYSFLIPASNNTILVTSTFNFCIYCVMGRKFRSVIKRCCRHSGQNNRTL